MDNLICKIMGLMDITSGILIIFAFDFKTLAIIFGAIMGFKGIFSSF